VSYEAEAEREDHSAAQRDWWRSGDASPGLSLAFVHEYLPGRAPTSSAMVTTAVCFGMTMSSSIAYASASKVGAAIADDDQPIIQIEGMANGRQHDAAMGESSGMDSPCRCDEFLATCPLRISSDHLQAGFVARFLNDLDPA
jgi:hypothetical protein